MTEQRDPGALDMWKARQGVVISGIAVDRAHRTEVDLARAEVERLSIEAATLRADLQMVRSQRDEAWAERCERVAWGEEGWRLAGNNAQLIDRMTEERDRARDLAVRAGAFEGCPDCAEREIERQHLIDEIHDTADARDQALYERDQCREAVEFSRGLIPTRPR